jgi:hypothetical protein
MLNINFQKLPPSVKYVFKFFKRARNLIKKCKVNWLILNEEMRSEYLKCSESMPQKNRKYYHHIKFQSKK